jgi:CheY-like chemotaxis protein
MLIIALTGWSQAEDRQRSYNAGFDQHMVKPLDIAAIQELLEGFSKKQRTG